LARHKGLFDGAVASSEATAERLKQHGIPVDDLNNGAKLDYYGHGAGEANRHPGRTQGGGAALTREKAVAAGRRTFLGTADESKLVATLGPFPLPVEVIPLARSHVAREIVKLGGDLVYRHGVVTDNGNVILDVHNLQIHDPRGLEEQLNAIVGVVCSGLFA